MIGIHTPLADKISLHKLEAGDVSCLLGLIGKISRKAEDRLGCPVRVLSVYEAGYDGFWLHRVLVAGEIRNHVIDPASLQVNRRARRAKTDKIDAKAMVRALMAHARGEACVFSVQSARSASWRGSGRSVRFATALGNEVFYREFANRRKLAGFVGLAPCPCNSGSMVRDQGISKAGSPKVRAMIIEMAWSWLRYQPQSALSKWFKARVGDMKGRIRRISIVALARKLLIALWRYLETGLVPDDAVLKA